MYWTFEDESCLARSSILSIVPIVFDTSVEFRSSSSTTSLTISGVIWRLPSLKPVSSALSQVLLMILGIPPEQPCTNAIASVSTSSSSEQPAIRKRQWMYSPGSCADRALLEHLRL